MVHVCDRFHDNEFNEFPSEMIQLFPEKNTHFEGLYRMAECENIPSNLASNCFRTQTKATAAAEPRARDLERNSNIRTGQYTRSQN